MNGVDTQSNSLLASGHIENAQPIPSARKFAEMIPRVVKGREGAVLSRGMILKEAAHYPSAQELELSLQGAPLFRATQLQIYGTAQPKLEGLRTILSILACYDKAEKPQNACWISTNDEVQIYIGGRSYILRDMERPKESITFTDSAENLEQMESRLKEDILKEARRYKGVVLVHEEQRTKDSDETKVVPVWLAADEVKTPRELFQTVKDEGYRISYHRIPITANQSPEREYLDAYLSLMRTIPVDDCLIFNCGMGVVRTTYAMSAALLVRRRQIQLRGSPDPFKIDFTQHTRKSSVTDSPRSSRAFEEVAVQKMRTRSLLKLMDILSQTTSFRNQSELIETLTTAPQVLENLRNALEGRYDIVLQLLSCLDDGVTGKAVVDAVLDHCDAVVNLRSMILTHRLQAASVGISASEEQQRSALVKGRRQLERYFFLISFASFLNTVSLSGEERFSQWVSDRHEIRNMISRLRDYKRSAQSLYAPANDLSSLSKTKTQPQSNSLFAEIAGNDSAWASTIVQNRVGITLRPGTILKRDHWHREEASSTGDSISPAYNFRRVPKSSPALFGLSQPKEGDIARIVKEVVSDAREDVTWVNLREEPLVYLNGTPFVLRDARTSLRNTRDYEGINAQRLEDLEKRLKSDVLTELAHFDGRILVHSEQPDGSVVAMFESVRPEDVKTLRECMNSSGLSNFSYKRLPITAELPLNYSDTSELFQLVKTHPQEAIVVNCQLGKGRSTLALITITLMQHWLHTFGDKGSFEFMRAERTLPSFQVLNNLLRVTRNSKEVKRTLDYFVLLCDAHVNLVDEILQCRDKARNSAPPERGIHLNRGLNALKRYFRCCILTIYLSEVPPTSPLSFKQFVAQRPVFKTLEKEFQNAEIDALTPLGMRDDNAEEHSDDKTHVNRRRGTVLSANTILKSDAFAGPEQRVLPEKIEGAVNFRRAPLYIDNQDATDEDSATLYGVGMPTTDGLRKALTRMDAGPDGVRTIHWTSLREEPVIFVDKRPFVLRLLDAPFENIITTGVRGETVERMEEALKKDVIAEAKANNGQILLHDEIVHEKGFELAPEWLSIEEADVLTTKELFASVQKEGFKVDYQRVPVTDEQAPLPDVFAAIETRVTTAVNSQHLAGLSFNCQLGRGRTTTGMVAAALTFNILLLQGEASDPLTSPVTLLSQSITSIDKEEDLFAKGEYKKIMLLLSILPRGRDAKRYTDAAIDQMDAMQNLRKAIQDYIKREAAETRSVKKAHLSQMAQNYLFRYGMLIAFSAYLLEKRQAMQTKQPSDDTSSFTQWISDKREIKRILKFGASFD